MYCVSAWDAWDSAYNYYETKEEIFLALLTEEYDRWTSDIKKLADSRFQMTGDELAHELAGILKDREVLLKILAVNLYEIEENSRLDNLPEYKAAFKKTVEVFEEVLRNFLSELSKEKIEEIRYAFYPFMYGIYPYVHPTVTVSRCRRTLGGAQHVGGQDIEG